MFNKFRKKSQIEVLIDNDGIEHATDRFAEIISRKLTNREIAYQFLLEELEGASKGNSASKAFASRSGIHPDEYRGAMDNSIPEVDGPDGPQQLLLALSLGLSKNPELMAEFRCKIDDKIMQRFEFGKYAKLDHGSDERQRITPGSGALDGPEFRQKLNEFFARLSELAERPTKKSIKIMVVPTDGSTWSWDFEFSYEELDSANPIIEQLFDYAQGWLIAPTSALHNDVAQEDDYDISF